MGMPKVQDARVQALCAIEALQRQPPAAVRASGIVERPRPHGQLPTVAALAAPPHSGRIAARDVGRLEGPVPLLVPLRQQIRMSELTCIVFSDMHARGAGHLECNATMTKGEYEPHQRAKPGYRGEEYDREDEQGDRPLG